MRSVTPYSQRLWSGDGAKDQAFGAESADFKGYRKKSIPKCLTFIGFQIVRDHSTYILAPPISAVRKAKLPKTLCSKQTRFEKGKHSRLSRVKVTSVGRCSTGMDDIRSSASLSALRCCENRAL